MNSPEDVRGRVEEPEARRAAQAVDPVAVENFVVAVLAAGGYRLDRAFGNLAALRENRLTDPLAVRDFGEGAIVQRLAASGYDRGPVVTTSMAKRLMALHAAVLDGTVEKVSRLLDEHRDAEAETLATTVFGIGPKVFKRFVLLHRSD